MKHWLWQLWPQPNSLPSSLGWNIDMCNNNKNKFHHNNPFIMCLQLILQLSKIYSIIILIITVPSVDGKVIEGDLVTDKVRHLFTPFCWWLIIYLLFRIGSFLHVFVSYREKVSLYIMFRIHK